MLQVGERPTAKLVYEKAERIITDCEQRLGLSVRADERNANNGYQVPNEDRSNRRPLIVRTNQIGPPAPLLSGHPSPSVEAEHPQGQPLPRNNGSPPILQTPPPRLHHNTSSQNHQSHDNGIEEAPQSSESQPIPSTPLVIQSQESAQRQPPQPPQEKPVLSVDDGIEWKDQCKAKRYPILQRREKPPLPGRTNLPSLNKRDHVSYIPL